MVSPGLKLAHRVGMKLRIFVVGGTVHTVDVPEPLTVRTLTRPRVLPDVTKRMQRRVMTLTGVILL